MLKNVMWANDRTGKERSFHRDLSWGLIHRVMGNHIPGDDIDYVERDYNSKPVALLEYKRNESNNQKDRVISDLYFNLGEMANLPVFTTIYIASGWDIVDAYDYDNEWEFEVIPQNERALKFVPFPTKMNILQYTKFLYHLRGLNPLDVNVEKIKSDYKDLSLQYAQKQAQMGTTLTLRLRTLK